MLAVMGALQGALQGGALQGALQRAHRHDAEAKDTSYAPATD